ncbi:hypothetical protein Syun_017684 [Stephania yunnanensis]|uniref:Bifunctional inhibitor/plant lipid transfer protein/seed storage helical domain-containing protein n=1 Tax=Stephania yunnanensis TaxID=152371 RepID=A0AAP0P2M2_9MAGN
MALPSKFFLFTAGFVVLLVGLSVCIHKVSGQGCQGDIQGLAQQCARYVQKPGPETNPSPGCCNVIKKVDVPCVCKQLTNDIEQIISMVKVAHVVAHCGRPLAHGTKCGSYIAP